MIQIEYLFGTGNTARYSCFFVFRFIFPFSVAACFNRNIIQVIYELKAGGVDERRLVGAKLEKLAEGETGLTRQL